MQGRCKGMANVEIVKYAIVGMYYKTHKTYNGDEVIYGEQKFLGVKNGLFVYEDEITEHTRIFNTSVLAEQYIYDKTLNNTMCAEMHFVLPVYVQEKQ